MPAVRSSSPSRAEVISGRFSPSAAPAAGARARTSMSTASLARDVSASQSAAAAEVSGSPRARRAASSTERSSINGCLIAPVLEQIGQRVGSFQRLVETTELCEQTRAVGLAVSTPAPAGPFPCRTRCLPQTPPTREPAPVADIVPRQGCSEESLRHGPLLVPQVGRAPAPFQQGRRYRRGRNERIRGSQVRAPVR